MPHDLYRKEGYEGSWSYSVEDHLAIVKGWEPSQNEILALEENLDSLGVLYY
jgi:hypothetical protein